MAKSRIFNLEDQYKSGILKLKVVTEMSGNMILLPSDCSHTKCDGCNANHIALLSCALC